MTSIRQPPLTADELSGFCAQMAMILKAGIPAREGLSIMRDDADDPQSRALLGILYERVEMGDPLSHALRDAGVFPRYVVDMAQIGEASGRLDEVLDSLTAYYERERSINASIKNAVTYPLVMLGMMLLVIAALAFRVLPIFRQVFDQLGASTSSFAAAVLRLGDAMGAWSLGLVAALAVCAVLLLVLRASPAGRRTLARWLAVFAPTRRLSARIATGRFAGAMALMLQSGLDPDQSLGMSARLADHPVVSRRIADCQARIAEGRSFSEALEQSGIFSGLSARMISVGFRTGAVDEVMKNLANRYEEEIDAELSHLVGVVEPTLVAVLSVAVGLILLSVMLPLMGVMSSIG